MKHQDPRLSVQEVKEPWFVQIVVNYSYQNKKLRLEKLGNYPRSHISKYREIDNKVRSVLQSQVLLKVIC